MTAYKTAAPTVDAPFIFLPCTGDATDLGNTGASWTVEGSPWTDYPGFFMGGTNRSIWTDDSVVSDMFSICKGATAGLDGRILFFSLKINDDPDGGATPVNGTFFQHGSHTTGNPGWKLLTSTVGRVFYTPTVNTTQTQINTNSVGVTEEQDTHICFFFDFKNGYWRWWNDSVTKFATTAARLAVLTTSANVDAHASIGVTFGSRNTGTSAGSRTMTSEVAWKMWDIFAMDLTALDDPHQYAERLQWECFNAGKGLLPNSVRRL